jgi:hypothetical protein
MTRVELAQIESALIQGSVGRFTDAELDGLSDPVQDYSRTAIATRDSTWPVVGVAPESSRSRTPSMAVTCSTSYGVAGSR